MRLALPGHAVGREGAAVGADQHPRRPWISCTSVSAIDVSDNAEQMLSTEVDTGRSAGRTRGGRDGGGLGGGGFLAEADAGGAC